MNASPKSPKDRVLIFDTTLRDGEQAPGFSMSTDAKLIVARALKALRVDIIEAGFAAASPGDAAAVKAVAEEIDGPVICSARQSFFQRYRGGPRARSNRPGRAASTFSSAPALRTGKRS